MALSDFTKICSLISLFLLLYIFLIKREKSISVLNCERHFLLILRSCFYFLDNMYKLHETMIKSSRFDGKRLQSGIKNSC